MIKLGFGKLGLKGLGFSNILTPVVAVWILATGFWNDGGRWIDSDVWID